MGKAGCSIAWLAARWITNDYLKLNYMSITQDCFQYRPLCCNESQVKKSMKICTINIRNMMVVRLQKEYETLR